MKASHLTTENPVSSLLKTKQSRASIISRSRVMKFLNEVLFDVHDDEVEKNQTPHAKGKDLDRL